MDLPVGIPCVGRWICISAVIVMLHLRLCSTGDVCPPEDILNPCTCFQDPEMKYPFRTTQMPIEVTQRKPITEESSAKERNEVVELANTEEVALITLPANATCCTVISCNAPKSLYVLEDIMANGLNRKWVDKLIVSNLPPEKGHTLVRLPRGFLKTLRVKHFEVRDTLLSGDFIHYGTPFEGQEQSMLWFTAKNCFLSGSLTYETVGTVHTKGLNYMPKIEGVDLSRNHLVFISATGFRYPPTNLSTIILSHNSIQGIETGAFHHAPNLKRLDLSHNLLEVIARNVLAAPARNLQHIDLSWNQLKVLPNDFFVNLPQLKVVILSNNFLTSLPNAPWASIWRQLTFVDLANNFLLCDCSLMWLVPILNPPGTKVSTTAAPVPLPGQIVLGSCSYVKPNVNSKLYKLTTITRASLNC